MTVLIPGLALCLTSLALWLSRRQAWAAQRPQIVAFATVAAYGGGLLFILGFCAGAHRHLWQGRSGFLNDIVGAGELFSLTSILAVAGVLGEGLRVLSNQRATEASRPVALAARTVRDVSLFIATLVAIHGVSFAMILPRLPK